MTPLQLAASAAQALAEPGTVGVLLTIPKGGMPKGFPRGELLNEMERDGRVERTYHFPPGKIIEWLVKNGLVEVERTGDLLMTFREPNIQPMTHGEMRLSAAQDDGEVLGTEATESRIHAASSGCPALVVLIVWSIHAPGRSILFVSFLHPVSRGLTT